MVRISAGTTTAGGAATAVGMAVKGRVCRVVTPGLSYKVVYEGFDYCILQFEDSLQRAEEPGPACPDHPTC